MQGYEDEKTERISLTTERRELDQLITDPNQLKLLILASTKLRVHELVRISACVNLIKLDISSNGLESLPSDLDFGRFSNLQLFYLHNNLLRDMASLNTIFTCKRVIYLTIFGNPISELSSIRHYIVNSMTNLKCLDFNCVLDEERLSNLLMNEEQCKRFRSLSRISWPIVVYPSKEELLES